MSYSQVSTSGVIEQINNYKAELILLPTQTSEEIVLDKQQNKKASGDCQA